MGAEEQQINGGIRKTETFQVSDDVWRAGSVSFLKFRTDPMGFTVQSALAGPEWRTISSENCFQTKMRLARKLRKGGGEGGEGGGGRAQRSWVCGGGQGGREESGCIGRREGDSMRIPFTLKWQSFMKYYGTREKEVAFFSK